MIISCVGDVSGDGAVGSADLNIVLASFGDSVPVRSGGDLSGDGLVDSIDLNMILAAFGDVCAALVP